MEPGLRLEQLISEQAALIEQMKHKTHDLELYLRFTYLDQCIREIEDGFSLSACLFAHRTA